MMQSIFGDTFPLFTDQVYHGLGIVGATVLSVSMATLLVLLPFDFYRIGMRLCQKSKFTVLVSCMCRA
ncbi:hypothetical protein H4582DRAFT_2035569 [Lactarius indigo]|nr:hypothetical protein H4582DRAFT_2035569 [Lactarius indigo]